MLGSLCHHCTSSSSPAPTSLPRKSSSAKGFTGGQQCHLLDKSVFCSCILVRQTKCITQWSLLFSSYFSVALVEVKFLLPPELAAGEAFWLQTLRKAQGPLQRRLCTEQLEVQLWRSVQRRLKRQEKGKEERNSHNDFYIPLCHHKGGTTLPIHTAFFIQTK